MNEFVTLLDIRLKFIGKNRVWWMSEGEHKGQKMRGFLVNPIYATSFFSYSF